MMWEDFYDNYTEWSEATIRSRIYALEDMGSGDEVVDVALGLPTVAAVSNLSAGSVATTFFIFLALFTLLLVVEVSILCRVIKNYNAHH